jgi:hypothetical protein
MYIYYYTRTYSMSYKKISELEPTISLSEQDQFAIVQNGVTKRINAETILNISSTAAQNQIEQNPLNLNSTLTSSGATTLTANTASTSTSTGTLVVTGGVGVSGNINAGGTVRLTGNTASTSTSTGTLVVTAGVGSDMPVAGVGVSGNINAGGTVNRLTGDTASTSTSTGTLVVTGGVGVSGVINAEGLKSRTVVITEELLTRPGSLFECEGSMSSGGTVLVYNSTASTDTGSGALTVGGGVGIFGNINAGGTVNRLTGNTASTSTSTGTLVVTGGVGVGGNINAGGTVNRLTGNTASTSTSTGTLVVTGGVGVSGNINAGGIISADTINTVSFNASSECFISGSLELNGTNGGIYLDSTIASTSTSTGAIRLASGGIGLAGNINAGGTVNRLTGNTASTSTSTGTLVVTGGVGVGGNINAGGTVNRLTGNTASTSTSTGTLVVTGGVGVSQDLCCRDVYASFLEIGNGNFIASSSGNIESEGFFRLWGNTASTSTSTGTLVVTGGVGVGGNIHVGGTVNRLTGNTASTSTSTGTLVVTGGVGIGGRASINDLYINNVFNTGVILETNSWSSGKISVRSEFVNLKIPSEDTDNSDGVHIFTVPSGYIFLIDTMEVLTTDITTPGTPPTISFGTSIETSKYYGPNETTSNSIGSRHIIENPQDAAVPSTIITFTVTSGSSASTHTGCGIVTGYLLKTS